MQEIGKVVALFKNKQKHTFPYPMMLIDLKMPLPLYIKFLWH